MDATFSDRACETCRERRVKCDKRLPSCQRCEQRGRACSGYKPARTFFDESTKVRRKYGHDRRDASGSRSDANLIAQVANIGRVPPSRQPPETLVTPASTPFSQAPPDSFQDVDGPSAYHTPDGPSAHSIDQAALGPSDQAGPDAAMLLEAPPIFPRIPPESSWGGASSEEDFFDLDIESYYANGNNACGFIPGVPVILSDTSDLDWENQSSNDYLTPSWTDAEHDPNVGQSGHHDSLDRVKEATILLRHFVETISPWMDIFDMDAYFGRQFPLKAKGNSMLRAAVAAVAAKQIAQLMEVQPSTDTFQHLSSVSMELDDLAKANWYYKAANYYDSGISYLRWYLQRAEIGSPMSAESLASSPHQGPPEKRRKTSSDSSNGIEDLLSAIAVFSLYESLSGYTDEWTHHLAGFQSLLKNQVLAQGDSVSLRCPSLDSIKGGSASFWSIAESDFMAAYTKQRPTQIDPEDLTLWAAAGLRNLTTAPSSAPGLSPATMSFLLQPSSREDDVCRTLVWLVSNVMNLIASPAIESPRLARWEHLRQLLSTWHQNLPALFQPYASMRATAAEPSPGSPRFTRLFFTAPMCAVAWQLYHFAQILLLMNRPFDGLDGITRLRLFRQVAAESETHARQICGIALGRNGPVVSRLMVQPLYVAGVCLENDEDRAVVVGLLDGIQTETGCSTAERVRELQETWGWNVSRE